MTWKRSTRINTRDTSVLWVRMPSLTLDVDRTVIWIGSAFLNGSFIENDDQLICKNRVSWDCDRKMAVWNNMTNQEKFATLATDSWQYNDFLCSIWNFHPGDAVITLFQAFLSNSFDQLPNWEKKDPRRRSYNDHWMKIHHSSMFRVPSGHHCRDRLERSLCGSACRDPIGGHPKKTPILFKVRSVFQLPGCLERTETPRPPSSSMFCPGRWSFSIPLLSDLRHLHTKLAGWNGVVNLLEQKCVPPGKKWIETFFFSHFSMWLWTRTIFMPRPSWYPWSQDFEAGIPKKTPSWGHHLHDFGMEHCDSARFWCRSIKKKFSPPENCNFTQVSFFLKVFLA